MNTETREPRRVHRNPHPAFGMPKLAISLMAVRHANAMADWTVALMQGDKLEIERSMRAMRRRLKAHDRLVDALARMANQ